MQSLPAARDDHVDVLVHPQQLRHQLAIGVVDVLDRVRRDPFTLQRRLDDFDERHVTAQRLATTSQNRRVASLEAERHNIDRYVRPSLVNHTDYADRNPPAHQPDAVRQYAALDIGPDRIRELGYAPRIV